MGKATRWFKNLLGMNKHSENRDFSNSGEKKDTKRWSFHKSSKVPARDWLRSYDESEQSKHAIAVAAATAAAADAAVAAAQAAVAVVRLTAGGGSRGREKGYWAAVKVQSAFRGYLARKALRALKGLVKIQALVRGYLVRKRAAATLHSMQTLFRAQAAIRSQRARRSINKDCRFSNDFRGRRSMERCVEVRSEFHSKRLSTSYESSLSPFEESPKIVEIDTYKPRSRSRRFSTSVSDYNDDPYYHVSSTPKKKNLENCEWGFYGDEYKFSTAQNTPRFAHSYKQNGPPTPSKSLCGDAYFRAYSNHPSYMANTQSFNAKLRSQSAPRQRPELVTKKKMSLEEIMASRSSLSGVRMQRSCSQAQETYNF